MKYPLGNDDILFFAVSPYLNQLATANENCVLIWNYENLKLMGICFTENLDIKAIYFFEPYPFLVVLDYSGTIYFFYLNYCESMQNYKLVYKL